MRYRSFILTASLTTLLAAPGWAQQQDSAGRSPQTPDSTAVYTLAPLVVTVSKVPLPASRVGFSLSLVTADELALERPLYAADALRHLSGAFIDEAAGPGGPTIVRLRGGEEVFTQILIDGVAANQNGGFFDFQGLSLTNLERIEVLRGPQSALYGSSAVSGVVNFISRRGQPGPPGFRFIAEGGNSATYGGSFQATGEVDGGAGWLSYSGGLGTAYNRGIYSVAHDTWSGDASLRLDARPSDRWSLTGTARYISVEGNLPVRDPGATRVPLDPNARNERDRIVSALRAQFAQSRSWSHALTVSFYGEDFRFADQRDDVGLDLGETGFFIFDADFTLDSDLRRPAVEYTGAYDFATGRRGDLVFSYGGRWERETLTDRTAGEFGDGTLSLDRSSVAGHAELRTDLLPRLDLLVGTRVEKFDGLPAELTPRASVLLELLTGRLALRAAAGRAYKAPNLQQQYLDNPFIASNPDLVAETSTSWELGIDASDAARSLSAGLTYFRQDFDNLIRTVTQENSTQQINRNLGASRAQGLEWMVRFRPSDAWLLGGEGAWVQTEVLDNAGLPDDQFPVGEELPFRPNLVGTAFVEARPFDRLTGIVRAVYVGEQTVLSERFSGARAKLNPYVLVNLRANWDLSQRLLLYARLDNLFDVAYETAFDRTGVPLTFALGAQVATGRISR